MLGSDYMYVEIVGIIVIFVALRALVAKNRAERLLYLNVIGFGVSAIKAIAIIDTNSIYLTPKVFHHPAFSKCRQLH